MKNAPIVVLPIGADDTSVSVAIASTGQILDGPMQVPMAVCALDDRFAVADTLAARVLLVRRPGRIDRVLPLEPLMAMAKLATTPAIVDLAPVGPAARPRALALADAANGCVLIVGLDGRWQRTVGRQPPGVLKSIGRIHVDAAGRIYLEDPAARRAVVFDAAGRHLRDLPEAITIAVDAVGRAGAHLPAMPAAGGPSHGAGSGSGSGAAPAANPLVAQPVFRGEGDRRDLALLDERGEPGFIVGEIVEASDIGIIRPLRATEGGEWLVWLANASEEAVVAIGGPAGLRDVWRGRPAAVPEMTTPIFADAAGHVFAVEIADREWRIRHLSK